MPHHGILESLIIMAIMKIVLVCTRKDLYGMIFHALVIEFIQFVNLYHIDSKKPFMYYLDIHCVEEL